MIGITIVDHQRGDSDGTGLLCCGQAGSNTGGHHLRCAVVKLVRTREVTTSAARTVTWLAICSSGIKMSWSLCCHLSAVLGKPVSGQEVTDTTRWPLGAIFKSTLKTPMAWNWARRWGRSSWSPRVSRPAREHNKRRLGFSSISELRIRRGTPCKAASADTPVANWGGCAWPIGGLCMAKGLCVANWGLCSSNWGVCVAKGCVLKKRMCNPTNSGGCVCVYAYAVLLPKYYICVRACRPVCLWSDGARPCPCCINAAFI